MKNDSIIGATWHITKQTSTEWWNDNTLRLAASLAFYTIFSLAPVLLIAVGIASLFLSRETAVQKIVHEMQGLMGTEGARAIRQVLKSSGGLGKGAWAIMVGLVTFFLGASAVFAELQAALNRIWDVKAQVRRGFVLDLVLDRLRSFSIALGVGFLLLVSLALSAAVSGLQDYLTNWMPTVPWLWQAANNGISFLVAWLLFAMIYKYLPGRSNRVARRLGGRGRNRASLYRGQVSDWHLPWPHCRGQHLWRGRFVRGPACLDLLLGLDQLFWR